MSGFVLTSTSSNQKEHAEMLDKIIQSLHIHDPKTFRYYAFFKNKENLRSFLEVLFVHVDKKTKNKYDVLSKLNTIFKKRDLFNLIEACLTIYNSFDAIGIDLLNVILTKSKKQVNNLFYILDNLESINNDADISRLLQRKTKNYKRIGVKTDQCFVLINAFANEHRLIFKEELKHPANINERLSILKSIKSTKDNEFFNERFIEQQIREADYLLATNINDITSKRTSQNSAKFAKSSLNTLELSKEVTVHNRKKRTRKSIEKPNKQLYTPEKNNLNKYELSSSSSLIFSTPAKKTNTSNSIEQMLNSPLLPALDSPREKLNENEGFIEINLFNDNGNVNSSNLLLEY